MIVKVLRLSPNNISIKNNINNRNRPPNAKKDCKENKKQRKTNLPPLNFSNLLRCINQIPSNNKNKEENENYYRITKNQKHPPFNKIIINIKNISNIKINTFQELKLILNFK